MSEVRPPEPRANSTSRQGRDSNAAASQEATAGPPRVGPFASILAQLCFCAAVVWRFQPDFTPLAATVTVGFAIHFWLPFRYKERFWIALSILGGAYVVAKGMTGGTLTLGALVVGLVLASALLLYGAVASPLPYRVRVLLVVIFFGGVVWAGTSGRAIVGAPPFYYRVFGSAFMFRIFTFLYEAKRFKTPVSLRDFLRYFFFLPQVVMVGPIVDYQKLGQTAFARRLPDIALEGIRWIARGMIQVAIFSFLAPKLRYATRDSDPRSVYLVIKHLVCAYAFYLRASGIIHVFVGILKLFGYDLPPPYRWYAVARSPLDFWRRANIYWKDAMLKVVYLPAYFAWRKHTDAGAKFAALGLVFVVSWALHVWQLSWLLDLRRSPWAVALSWPQEALTWLILGTACAVNLAMEIRAADRPPTVPAGGAKARLPRHGRAAASTDWLERSTRYVTERIALPPGMHPLRWLTQVVAMWLLIGAVFSLQNAPSTRVWLQTLKWWNSAP